MQKKQNVVVSILENFTILMILLVLVQTFMEDFSVYIGLSVKTTNNIRLAAFIFDAYFTLEFLVRLIASIAKKKCTDYIFYKNGWIDFLASIPLLLLISGPLVLSQVFDINIFSVAFINTIGLLKVIKSIRVARILRLLRVLKIFGKIKNVQSVMAQRHISTISTIVVFSIVIFLVTVSTLQETDILPSRYSKMIEKENSINRTYKELYNITTKEDLVNILNNTPKYFNNVMEITYNDEILFSSNELDSESMDFYQKVNEDIFKTYEVIFYPNNLMIKYSREEFFRTEAFYNVLNFILIIFVLIIIVVIYTRHFALTVSDPVFVMRMGFEKKDYTLAVKIQEHFEEDDIFLLANDYNSRWLPAKIRKLTELKDNTSMLSLKDAFDK